MLIVLAVLTALLICALIAVNVAYIRHLEAKDRRHDEQVNRLVQRVAAPQMAAIEHAQALIPSVQASDGIPPTDDQLAEQQEHAAALKHLAEIEREFAGRQL